MSTLDSKWDCRQPFIRDDLAKAVMNCLSKKHGVTTRTVAHGVRCNTHQARRMLTKLWEDGKVIAEGDRRQRVWYKA